MLHKLQTTGLFLIVASLIAGCGATPTSTPTVPFIPTNTLGSPLVVPTDNIVPTATTVSTTAISATTASPTDTPTETPTINPTATNTPTPEASSTDTPTNTPQATSTPTASPTPAVHGVVNPPGGLPARLRSGPGQDFTMLQPVKAGTSVILLGTNGAKDWVNIQLDDGSQGWLLASLISVPNAVVAALPTVNFSSHTPQPSEGAVQNATSPATTSAVTVTAVATSSATTTATATATTTSTVTLTPTSTGHKPFARLPNDVLAYCDDPVNGEPRKIITAGTSVTVWWAWYAKTPEQLQDHIENAVYDVRVDGLPLSNWSDFRSGVIKSAKDGNYYVFWYVPVTVLQLGAHKVDYKVTWKQQISDGYGSFGPGTKQESNVNSCVFTVK